jgi:hypothetical protein
MIENLAKLEESIYIAVDSLSGVTASRTGPFIPGYISLEGPEHPNEPFRQYNSRMSRVDSSLIVSPPILLWPPQAFLRTANLLA